MSTKVPPADAPKGSHDPFDCMDHAQLNALFEDAQRVKAQPLPADKNIDWTPEQKRNIRWGF